MPSGLDPQRRSVSILRSPFQRPQNWHPAFTGSGRGLVGPFGFSMWLLPAPSRGLAHQAPRNVRPGADPPLGAPAAQSGQCVQSFFASYDVRAKMALQADVVVGAPGSAGVFRTQYVDLLDPLPLDCGRTLDHVRLAYETYGRLSPAKDNVILVCH